MNAFIWSDQMEEILWSYQESVLYFDVGQSVVTSSHGYGDKTPGVVVKTCGVASGGSVASLHPRRITDHRLASRWINKLCSCLPRA